MALRGNVFYRLYVTPFLALFLFAAHFGCIAVLFVVLGFANICVYSVFLGSLYAFSQWISVRVSLFSETCLQSVEAYSWSKELGIWLGVEAMGGGCGAGRSAGCWDRVCSMSRLSSSDVFTLGRLDSTGVFSVCARLAFSCEGVPIRPYTYRHTR